MPRAAVTFLALASLAATLVATGGATAGGAGSLPAPTGLAVTASPTSLFLTWNRVNGAQTYGVYLDRWPVGMTVTTSWTFRGLKCGTSHLLQVDARDLSGRRSARAGITASTSPCVPPPPPPPPPSGSALVVSTTGSDSNPCTQAAPCLTFDRAYHVAKPGQVVQVLAGSYASQLVKPDGSKSAPAVVFQPAAGAQVSVAGLTVQGTYLEFDDLTITGSDGWYVGINSNSIPPSGQAHDVTFRNVRTSILFITGASNVAVIGGSVGPYVDNASQIKGCYNCTYAPQKILLDGVLFHDYTRATEGAHMECLHVYPAQGLVIRNSRFFNCAIMDVFLNNYGSGGDLRDITIENNWFDAPGSHGGPLSQGYYPLMMGPGGRTMTNVLIDYNSFNGTPSVDANGTVSNVVLKANVAAGGGGYQCVSGIAYDHNIWAGSPCSATDRQAPAGFVDPINFNLDLVVGAAAINAGDPKSYPAADIHGTRRPRGSGPDAGADEAA